MRGPGARETVATQHGAVCTNFNAGDDGGKRRVLNSKSESGSTAAYCNSSNCGCDHLLRNLHRAVVVSLVVAATGWWIQMLTFYVLLDWGGHVD